jgi:hypothetical protein
VFANDSRALEEDVRRFDLGTLQGCTPRVLEIKARLLRRVKDGLP